MKDPSAYQPLLEVKKFERMMFELSSHPFGPNATLRYDINNYAVGDPEFVIACRKDVFFAFFRRTEADARQAEREARVDK